MILPAQAGPESDLPVLTLGVAAEIAGRSDPLVNRFRRLAEARRNGAVADGQLPDPKLKLGLAKRIGVRSPIAHPSAALPETLNRTALPHD